MKHLIWYFKIGILDVSKCQYIWKQYYEESTCTPTITKYLHRHKWLINYVFPLPFWMYSSNFYLKIDKNLNIFKSYFRSSVIKTSPIWFQGKIFVIVSLIEPIHALQTRDYHGKSHTSSRWLQHMTLFPYCIKLKLIHTKWQKNFWLAVNSRYIDSIVIILRKKIESNWVTPLRADFLRYES